jgi:hypothetical protein
MFGAPAPSASAASPFAAPLGSAPAPSEYTRMIRQAVTPPPPVAAPSAPAPAPALPVKRAVPLPLLVIGNVVLLLAVALVLYFLLRTKPASVPSVPAAPRASVPSTAPATSPAP